MAAETARRESTARPVHPLLAQLVLQDDAGSGAPTSSVDLDLGRYRRRTRRSLLAAVAVESLGTGVYLPPAVLYFLKGTQLDLGTIGLLVGTGTAVTPPGSPGQPPVT
ncbi:hypothetical protein ACGH7X_39400 [Streptomyces sp. BBFR51]|uniref:hypothetical protein n=1 Tax=Streptomyces sp. BBFR51 TaxID=3372856 RepID=UPI0037DD9B48